jgi:flavodoxin
LQKKYKNNEEENFMRTLIVYSSQTGNTKKLAEVVYDALDGEKDMFAVKDAPSTQGYDMVAVGFWLMAGKPDPESSKFLGKLGRDDNVFLFATHGASADSDHVKNAVNHAVNLTDGAQLKGAFTCQGEVNPKVLEKVRQKPEPPVWIDDADMAVGHPDDQDLAALRKVIEKL